MNRPDAVVEVTVVGIKWVWVFGRDLYDPQPLFAALHAHAEKAPELIPETHRWVEYGVVMHRLFGSLEASDAMVAAVLEDSGYHPRLTYRVDVTERYIGASVADRITRVIHAGAVVHRVSRAFELYSGEPLSEPTESLA